MTTPATTTILAHDNELLPDHLATTILEPNSAQHTHVVAAMRVPPGALVAIEGMKVSSLGVVRYDLMVAIGLGDDEKPQIGILAPPLFTTPLVPSNEWTFIPERVLPAGEHGCVVFVRGVSLEPEKAVEAHAMIEASIDDPAAIPEEER